MCFRHGPPCEVVDRDAEAAEEIEAADARRIVDRCLLQASSRANSKEVAMRTLAAALCILWIVTLTATADAEPLVVPIEVQLRAYIPELTGDRGYVAEGTGETRIDIGEGGATIDDGDIPRLIHEGADLPEGWTALTLVLEGIPGVKSAISWEAWPVVTIKPIALHARIYDLPLDRITDESEPVYDFDLAQLSATTETISEDGVSVGGFMDKDNMVAQFSFLTALDEEIWPKLYAPLAGQIVLGEIRFQTAMP